MSDFNINDFLTAFESKESLSILLFLIVAYLLGILTGALMRGGKIRRLKKEVKEKDQELQDLRIKVDELNEHIALRDADLQKARFEQDDLRTRIQVLEADKEQLVADRNIMVDRFQHLQLNHKAQEDTIEDLKEQLSRKEVVITNTGNTGTDTDTSSYSQTSNIGEGAASGEVKELQALYLQTRKQLDQLEQKIGKLEEDNSSLQEDLHHVQEQSKKVEIAPDSFDRQVFGSSPKSAEVIGGRLSTQEVGEKDDLTLINGIGPFLEKKLNQVNVHTYKKISSWTPSEISETTRAIGFFPGRIEQDNWVGQAARLYQMKLENPNAFTKQGSYPTNPKDLKVIAGVGPKTEELLKQGGVRNWVELASTDVERLRAILREAGAPFDTLNPSTWPEQARLASNGEWERFEDYQGYLGVD